MDVAVSYYRFHLSRFLAWCDEQRASTLADLTPTRIRTYLVQLQARELSAWTIHGTARALRAFLNFSVAEELIPTSPMAKVRMPRIDRRILPAFGPQDVERLLDACEHDRDRAVVLFLLDTGIRAAEFVLDEGRDSMAS